MSLMILYIRNWGLLLNKAACTLVGQDPRKTISAVAHLKGISWLESLANWLYSDPEHCKVAARGWDDPTIIDRSLW